MSKRPGKRPRGRPHRQLTPQEELFCQEYFRSPSAAQAAVRAGYNPSAAKQTAYRLQHKPVVAKRLEQLAAELQAREPVTQPRLERETETLAFSDLRDLATINAEGEVTVLPSTDWTPGAAAAVKKIRHRRHEIIQKDGSTSATTELEVELHPKLQAIELLGRFRKFLRTDTPFGGGDGTGRIIPAVALPPVRE